MTELRRGKLQNVDGDLINPATEETELDSVELLGEIVNELKQIKFHLSMGSDMSLDNGDTVD